MMSKMLTYVNIETARYFALSLSPVKSSHFISKF